jgi:Xaa-Pro aminopeptidase
MSNFNRILPLREQDRLIMNILKQRFETILPAAMREAGLDMWVILCQEDDPDPVFRTMIPLSCWTPILQMLVFYDRGEEGIERINLSMTDMHDLYDKPWKGFNYWEQWPLLAAIIRERNPKKIGLNIGKTQWAGGGLTHNLYQQFMKAIDPEFRERIVDAEQVCTRWLMTLSDMEVEIYPHIVSIAHQIIAHCYSHQTIHPGVTTTDDLEWVYWQTAHDLGLEVAFKPFFRILRSNADQQTYPVLDKVIRPGDLLHCDVGVRYLRLNTDHQEAAYVLRTGERDAPEGIKNLLFQCNRLQNVFMGGFQRGLSGNEMLNNILQTARAQDIPTPKVYSHSMGLYLHEPGPLIGLPWEQVSNPGRGDVQLEFNSTFTMELSVETHVPEWDQTVRMGAEQDVIFTKDGCMAMDGVQTELYLI